MPLYVRPVRVLAMVRIWEILLICLWGVQIFLDDCYLVMDITKLCFVGIPDRISCGRWSIFWEKASNCDNVMYITSLRLELLVSCRYLI